MMETNTLKYIETMAVLFLIYITYFYGVRRLIIKYYQQHLFTLRDNLFVLFHKKYLNNKDQQIKNRKGYDVLREWLNESIRLADTFNSIDSFLLKRIFKQKFNNKKNTSEELKIIIDYVSNDIEFKNIFDNYNKSTLIFMTLRRPIHVGYQYLKTYIILFAINVTVLFLNVLKSILKVFNQRVDNKKEYLHNEEDFNKNILKEYMSTVQPSLIVKHKNKQEVEVEGFEFV